MVLVRPSVIQSHFLMEEINVFEVGVSSVDMIFDDEISNGEIAAGYVRTCLEASLLLYKRLWLSPPVSPYDN